jgi:hypothetical protein
MPTTSRALLTEGSAYGEVMGWPPMRNGAMDRISNSILQNSPAVKLLVDVSRAIGRDKLARCNAPDCVEDWLMDAVRTPLTMQAEWPQRCVAPTRPWQGYDAHPRGAPHWKAFDS